MSDEDWAISSQSGCRLFGRQAKYEIEDGKVQLSVYTLKADKFFEVIVDHNLWEIAKCNRLRFLGIDKEERTKVRVARSKDFIP